jgi:hypothetical protein
MTGTEDGQIPTDAGTSPARYSYYIRCERTKKNNEQCRAPALKGTRVCYKHTQQDEAARRRKEAIASLELPQLTNARDIQAALQKIMQAILDNRIDEDCGGVLLRQVRAAMSAGRSMGVLTHGAEIASQSIERK